MSEGPLLLLGFTQLETNLQTSVFQILGASCSWLVRAQAICHLPQGPNVYKVVHSVFYVHAECQLLGEFDARKTIIFLGDGNSKEHSFCPSLSLSPSSLSSLLF